MSEENMDKQRDNLMPSAEQIAEELAKIKSADDFFGKDGAFARLFAKTMETMLEAELTDHLGYERYEAKGRNSGNSRNGHYSKKLRASSGDTAIKVPRDRRGEFEPEILKRYAQNTNELEEKILGMYAKGMSVRDIREQLEELYGVDVSAQTISAITDKVWADVEEWQSRPLAPIYPIIYLDAIHVKIRHKGRVENVAVHVVLGVDLDGHRDVLGHWVSEGAESANFWLKVITDLQNRGVEDVFIACIDGLAGFEDAIHSVFPKVRIQRCVIHQIRNSLKYVSWKERKAFTADLKTVYRAAT
jgi:putative transposase